MLHTIAFVLAMTFAGAAAGQAPRPDPADPKARVPAPRYESVFKEYRRYEDTDLSGWRAVNDEMNRLRGHLGHVPPRAQQGDKPPAKSAAPSPQGAHK